jgi:hypothetical protein
METHAAMGLPVPRQISLVFLVTVQQGSVGSPVTPTSTIVPLSHVLMVVFVLMVSKALAAHASQDTQGQHAQPMLTSALVCRAKTTARASTTSMDTYAAVLSVTLARTVLSTLMNAIATPA